MHPLYSIIWILAREFTTLGSIQMLEEGLYVHGHAPMRRAFESHFVFPSTGSIQNTRNFCIDANGPPRSRMGEFHGEPLSFL